MKSVLHQIGKDPLYNIWHTSEDHLIMYFYSSGGSIVCAGDDFPIKKGSLVFIAADTYHYTLPDSPASYDRSKLFVSKSEWNKILDLLSENNAFKKKLDKAIVYAEIEEGRQEETDEIFNAVNACTEGGEMEFVALSACLKLLLFLGKYSKASTSTFTGLMAKAVNHINKNIALDIDVDSICSAVNISKYYFCRQFKKHTGMTVMEYILKTRIVLAKNDLKKTGLSVTEISEKYGFSSVSYFSRIFKEKEKLSPLKYRKQSRI